MEIGWIPSSLYVGFQTAVNIGQPALKGRMMNRGLFSVFGFGFQKKVVVNQRSFWEFASAPSDGANFGECNDAYVVRPLPPRRFVGGTDIANVFGGGK